MTAPIPPRIDPDVGLARALEQVADIMAREFGADPDAEIDVAAVRRATGLTQAAFAARFNIPVGTLRNWEQGRRRPEGPARALLSVIATDPARAVRAAERADAREAAAKPEPAPLADLLAPTLGARTAAKVAADLARRLGRRRITVDLT